MSVGAPYEQLPSEVTRRRLGLLSEGELALALGLCATTVEGWRQRGVGPAWVKLGQQVFFYEPDVLDWIQANRHYPTPRPKG